MILLNTNVLSELMRSAPEKIVLEWIDSQPASELYPESVKYPGFSLKIGAREKIFSTKTARIHSLLAYC